MSEKAPLPRPCWNCDWVFTGEQARMLRKAGNYQAECPLCGAMIGLYGRPNKRREGDVHD